MTTKTCFKCGETKPLTDFYAHKQMADGYLGKCKACTKSDTRNRYYDKHDEVRAYESARQQTAERRAKKRVYGQKHINEHPDKYKARYTATNAMRDGKLLKHPCEVCGAVDNVEAHHEDYSKPLEVMWLCACHHKVHHGYIKF